MSPRSMRAGFQQEKRRGDTKSTNDGLDFLFTLSRVWGVDIVRRLADGILMGL